MLFGHQEDTTTMPTGQVAEPSAMQDASLVADAATTALTNDTTTSLVTDTSSNTPSAPMLDNPLSDETGQTADSTSMQSVPTENTPTTADNTASSNDVAAPSELFDLKQQALGQLTPLVDHLEQTPEEKFRTTMMMIQSTDNQALLKDAYEAAQAITDDKARAQALLDVINEINYFTQQKK